MQQKTLISRVPHKALSLGLSLLMVVSLNPALGTSGQAFANPTAAEKQAEAEQALANLNAMQETLDRLSNEYGEALAAQEEAEAKSKAAEERLGEINVQLEDVQARLNDRARDMYRSGSISFIEMLLGAASFTEFASNWDLLNRVNENDANLTQERRELAQEAEEQATIYSNEAAVAAQKAEEAEKAEQQAEGTVAEMQSIYDGLNAEAAQLLEEERQAQEAAEAARAQALMEEQSQAQEEDPYNPEPSPDPDYVEPAPVDSSVVGRAQACLGAPYVWGGVGPDGYDCSGLVSYCLTGVHARLGTTTTFMGWPQVSNPQPGDVCVNSGHTGIYIGGGQMIHAATYGVGVIVGPVQGGMIFVRYGG